MRTLILILCMIFVSPFLGFTQAVTSTQISEIPFSGVYFNPCTGETIEATGSFRSVLNITTTPSGTSHITIHVASQGIGGVSSSGIQYRAMNNFTVQSDASGSQFSSTAVQTFNLIGQGPGENLQTHVIFHFTINAKGEFSSTIENTRMECAGSRN